MYGFSKLRSLEFEANGLMQCCHGPWGAAAAAASATQLRLLCARHRSSGAISYSKTRGSAHLEQFTYRPKPSPLKAPSLRRGWILNPSHGAPDRALEILLPRWEEDQEPGREEDLSQAHQWRSEGERGEHSLRGMHHSIDESKVSWASVKSDREVDHPIKEDELENKERPILTKPKYVRGPAIDKKSFIRIYYIAALRVPAADCWNLVFQLRQHLLNWPRVNNVGRVPGDDVDEDLATVFLEAAERKKSVTRDQIRAAVYTDSEKELSGKKLAAGADGKCNPEVATLLELVEPQDENEQDFAVSVPYLIRSKKWTGPTRLLLLDEMYLGRKISELPPDLQAVYSRFEHLNSKSGLANCRLTIFYEYWTMDEVLWELLPETAHAPVKFYRAGHVAELRLHPEHLPFRHLIAQVTLEKNKPAVRSVILKREIHDAEKYAVQLELLAGTTSLVTTAWEYGIPFRIDMAYMIWDSRLGSERQRLVNSFARNDVICDICAGVGAVAIPASKKVRMVYANDVNPHTHHYLGRNVIENKVSGRIEVFNEDIETFLGKIFHVGRPLPVTQVIMSHPLPAAEFLGLFQGLFSRRTWRNALLPRIHLYGILGEHDPEERFSKGIQGVLQSSDTCEISTRRVVKTAREEWIVCASFILPAEFGFE